MNKVILVGRMVKDAELRYLQNGTATCSFVIAVNRSYTKDGERQADFPQCVAWGKTAEFISQYFNKGKEICLEGNIQTRSYETQDGSRRFVTEVRVDRVEFVGSKAQNGNNEVSAASDGFAGEVSFSEEELPF